MATVDEIIDDVQVGRLTAALKQEAAHMGREQARYLVDAYYAIQEYRKAANNQVAAGLRQDNAPYPLVSWLGDHMQAIEGRIKSLLGVYAAAQPVGLWSQSICGIGPVISAGLLAHIDIHKAPTAGHIWRFAGLDSSLEWLGEDRAKKLVAQVQEQTGYKSGDELLAACAVAVNRRADNIRALMLDKDGKLLAPTATNIAKVLSRRPHNAALKTLCWKIGESFVKVSGNDSDVYGKVYNSRKALEQVRNDEGSYADQAATKLERFNIGKTTEAYAHYSTGKLPPGHVHARAKRYAVKLFLSHWQHVAWESEFGEPPPKPYILTQPGHAHFAAPPNWPL